jgi:ABC-type phosphate transport system permease subunit
MACPVCFGGDDPMMRESLNAGIGVLVGVTTIVLGLFGRFFLTLARRSRESAHLVGMTASKAREGVLNK